MSWYVDNMFDLTLYSEKNSCGSPLELFHANHTINEVFPEFVTGL